MKKRNIIIGLCIVVLLGGGYLYNKRNDKSSVSAADTKQYYTLARQSINKTIFTDGTIKPSVLVNVYAPITGSLNEINVEVGDKVTKGDVLAVLDTSDLETSLANAQYQLRTDQDQYDSIKSNDNSSLFASYESAKSSYNQKKDQYAQNQSLYDQGIISKSELDASKLSVDSSYSSYISTRSNLNNSSVDADLVRQDMKIDIDLINIASIEEEIKSATITAPVSGTITNSITDMYQKINANTQLFVIQNIDELIVEANISEYEISEIKLNQSVEITTLGLKDKIYKGKVIEIDPAGSISGSEVLVGIKIDILDEDEALLSNFTANIEIEISRNDDALVIPYEAINTKGTNEFILVLRDEKDVPVPIKRGIEGDLYVEVLSNDLKEGDQILLSNGSFGYDKSFNPLDKGLGKVKGSGTRGK